MILENAFYLYQPEHATDVTESKTLFRMHLASCCCSLLRREFECVFGFCNVLRWIVNGQVSVLSFLGKSGASPSICIGLCATRAKAQKAVSPPTALPHALLTYKGKDKKGTGRC